MEKSTGILMNISSLPSKYGIGSFSKEAYDFVDFLHETKNKYWQVLPLNQTSYGDSPYQSPSAYAGNPYYIDLDVLVEKELITQGEVSEMYVSENESEVDFGSLFYHRYIILRKAYSRFVENAGYKKFTKQNAFWLDDYAVFMAIKVQNGFASFLDWEDKYKKRRQASIDKFQRENQEEINFWKYLQFEFFNQYFKLKKYANKKGVKIIGDMPIYVALDSVDLWANKKEFLLNSDMTPKVVAGCPPDYFSEDGQLWGNPIYNWRYMKKNDYKFWENRIKFASTMYDFVRIDHFRAFAGYYVIDAKAEHARDGEWKKGVGYHMFETLSKSIDVSKIIAEDLGTLTPDVYKLIKKTGYMGMKVLQFGLSGDVEDEHFCDNYAYNIISYTGTHDNSTTQQFIDELPECQKEIFDKLLGDIQEKSDTYKMIGGVLGSNSRVAIIPIQDYLQVGIEGRMNFPGKVGYWKYRIKNSDITEELKAEIKAMVVKYKRNQK